MLIKLYLTIIALLSCAAFADYGPYRAEYISAYDGDTMTLVLHVAPGWFRTTRVRLSGADAPEIRGACREEKTKAILARDAVRNGLTTASEVRALIHGTDKYGRWLASVYVDGESLADMLISRGLARPWSGRREGWC